MSLILERVFGPVVTFCSCVNTILNQCNCVINTLKKEFYSNSHWIYRGYTLLKPDCLLRERVYLDWYYYYSFLSLLAAKCNFRLLNYSDQPLNVGGVCFHAFLLSGIDTVESNNGKNYETAWGRFRILAPPIGLTTKKRKCLCLT